MKILAVAVSSLFLSTAVSAADRKPGGEGNVPPGGFTALFNGKDLAGWRGLGHVNPYEIARWSPEEKAARQKAADEDLRKHWRVEDGEIINDGAGVYLTTGKDYRDFELLVDWRMMSPNTDSGIYLRGSPQVQIWDPKNESVRSAGADKGSGALWNNSPGAPGRFPPVLADKPVGEWNTFRILMVGERVSVWLNGRQTVDWAVMENYWDRKKPLPPAGPIQLQTHGGEMRFRNLFIRELDAEEANRILQTRGGEGFRSRFNGKNLDGWIGQTDAYTVRDGTLAFAGTKRVGDIFLKDLYSDFAIRFEFKLPPGGNNGLLLRTPDTKPGGTFSGMEIQILDDGAPQYKTIREWQHTGSVYGLAAAHTGYLRPVGQWNFMEVVADGPVIQVFLNGTKITDADLSRIEKPLDDRGHPGMKRTDGYVGFMGHGDPVEFRNIRVKPLRK